MPRFRRLSPNLPTLAACLAILSAAPGCNRHVFSPPARPVALDAPRVLAPGETAVGLFGSTTDSLVDTTVAGGTIAVRRGLTERIEGSVEGSAFHVSEPRAEDRNRVPGGLRKVPSATFVSGRAGTKVALLGKHLSLLAGVGGGHHAGGGFLTPDVGLTIGYDNRYFVPFLLGRIGVSQPVGAKDVDLTRTDETEGSVVERARTTAYYGITIGGRIPIEPASWPIKGALIGGVSLQEVRDAANDHSGFGASGGAEITF